MCRELSSVQYAQHVAQQGPSEKLKALLFALEQKDDPLFDGILTALARNVAPAPAKRRSREPRHQDDHVDALRRDAAQKRLKPSACCA
mmetsp:Transcript_18988/g.59659  ORF Transcript_18988/g.59659 Transcript_18988/m.59659 type:complete len:88 (+) Transcript_18988:328-591(+)